MSTIVHHLSSPRKVVFARVVLFPPFLMNSLLESGFSLSPHSGVELLSSGTVSDLGYADDVLLSEDPGSLQDLLCSLDKSAAMFGMRFAPPECKMMLQDWVGVTPNLSIKGQIISLPIWAVASLPMVV